MLVVTNFKIIESLLLFIVYPGKGIPVAVNTLFTYHRYILSRVGKACAFTSDPVNWKGAHPMVSVGVKSAFASGWILTVTTLLLMACAPLHRLVETFLLNCVVTDKMPGL